MQHILNLNTEIRRTTGDILTDVEALLSMHKNGLLGGALMPEDAHPDLPLDSFELVHYLTLPMALNYQRDSYSLWRAATAAFNDPETVCIFSPKACVDIDEKELSRLLLKHRVALQPIKHTATWMKLCQTLVKLFDGDVRNLFKAEDYSIDKILKLIQIAQKKEFPYLSGPKIANYWLYVIHSYTSHKFNDRHSLSVAPDTHVLQASLRLGLVSGDRDDQLIRAAVSEAWRDILKGTDWAPIDIHTPLWLWSRGGFPPIIYNNKR